MIKISSQTVIETVVALPNPTEQVRIIECFDTYNTRIRTEEAYLNKLKLQKTWSDARLINRKSASRNLII